MQLVACKACGEEYGSFRKRCPACGEIKPPQSVNRARFVPACVACERPNATVDCPKCHLKVHQRCLELHLKYQHQQGESR